MSTRPASRLALVALAVALALGAALLAPPPARALGVWTPTGSLGSPRVFHSATLLTDGRVLIAGGGDPTRMGPTVIVGAPLNTAKLFDPATNGWTEAAPLAAPRYGHAATLLPNGQVLVAGGTIDVAPTASTERYDPGSNAWVPAAAMLAARSAPSIVPLADGAVLIFGTGDGPNGPLDAERYEPMTDTWMPLARMHTPRAAQTATLLRDGRVLIVGAVKALPAASCPSSCYTTAAELYDPTTDTWADAAPKPGAFADGHAATLLPDGQVLITGGCCDPSGRFQAQRYDPAADRWSPAGGATKASSGPAVALRDGRILVLVPGGANLYGPAAELYDATTDSWERVPGPGVFPIRQTFTTLTDGRVLAAGGSPVVAAIYDDTANRAGACFGPTDNAAEAKCVTGRFFDYWQTHGGLALHGYPLTEARRETLEDGKQYTVQWFERTRLEYHAENAPPNDVLLGQFGRRIRPADPPVPPDPRAGTPGWLYFPQTGHNLGDGFLAYWGANGGLAQFGYPISEVFVEKLEDGKTYRVQYFERARFEYHPENAPPYDILLGQFGRRLLPENRR